MSGDVGYVGSGSKTGSVGAITSRPLPVGEYVVIADEGGDVFGMVVDSTVESAAFSGVRNFEDAQALRELVGSSSRDKAYSSEIALAGRLEGLVRAGASPPAVPPLPGSPVRRAEDDELAAIFSPRGESWVRIGSVLRSPRVPASIDIDRAVARHVAILAMTGMGKSNAVSLLVREISRLGGTAIIFDYHDDYATLRIPRISVEPAKINPRLLNSESLARILEIRDNASKQLAVVDAAFTEKVRRGKDFWAGLESAVGAFSDEPQRKEYRGAAQRVLSKIRRARSLMGDVLDAESGNPMELLGEGRANVLSISEMGERQANVALAFYMREILADRKAATISRLRGRRASPKFSSPVFIVIEEAHAFLPHKEDTAAKYWASKIAREGRKFGVGLCVVSQRPRSVDIGVLSQMGSFAIMKMIQHDDQAQVAAAVESADRRLIEQITSLGVGDAILTGAWTGMNSVVHIDRVGEKLAGSDPSAVDEWATARKISEAGVEVTGEMIQRDLLKK